MNSFPTLRLKGMSSAGQAVAAARFLPSAIEAIRMRRLSVPATFFVATETGQASGISSGDVLLKASPGDLDRIQRIIVALEDRRFHSHDGIDFRGLLRAAIANIRALRVVQGGSTITQQLVRNTLLGPDRTLIRKICEVILARSLERYYTKDEILDLYCHHVYLGNGTRGFPAAAKLIFRRSIRELGFPQLCALAGLLRNPSRTHPVSHSGAFAKRATLLGQLLGTKTGKREVTPTNPVDTRNLPRSRHTTQIRNEIGSVGLGEQEIARVTTSINPLLQTALNQVLSRASGNHAVHACAGIVLDVRSSEVVAEASWAEGKEAEFSVAFGGRIQPGSTFKPFAVLSALQQGFAITQELESAPFVSADLGNRGSKAWQVRNYGHVYRGRVTLLEALRTSDNTAFARLSEMMDRDALARTYEGLRLCDRGEATPAIVLGAHRAGVSLAALANAYATVARFGVYVPYRLVRLIEFQDGTVVRPPRAKGELVPCDYSAFASLRSALAHCGVRTSGKDFAGKTGTTALGSLFAAYDDRLSYAIWVGFRDPMPEADPKALSAVVLFEELIRRTLGSPAGLLSI